LLNLEAYNMSIASALRQTTSLTISHACLRPRESAGKDLWR
jgi:hypothetical protein